MIKLVCSSKSHHTQLRDPKEEPSVTYQVTFKVSSECQDVYTKLPIVISRTEFECYDVGGTYTLSSTVRRPGVIPYRGSVTDLATDIAYELKPHQARELIQELERFLGADPGKFKS